MTSCEALKSRETDGGGEPRGSGPWLGDGRNFKDGMGTRPQIFVKLFSVSLWESLPQSLTVGRSACVSVSCVCREPISRACMTLWQLVILEPRVFIADFKYLFHGRQRHSMSFYNLLVVIE